MASDEPQRPIIKDDASHGEAWVKATISALLGLFIMPFFFPIWAILIMISPIAPRWSLRQAMKVIEWTDQHFDTGKEFPEYDPESGERGPLNSKRRIRK